MIRAVLASGLLAAVSSAVAAQPPTAPPPREVPSQAELIIGDWVLTKVDGRSTSKNFDFVKSFNRDGTYRFFARGKDGQIGKVSTGVYRVGVGDVAFGTTRLGDGSDKRVTILHLTRTEMVLHVPGADGVSRMDYIRDQPK